MHSSKAHAGDAEGVDPLNPLRSSYAGLFLGKARAIHFQSSFLLVLENWLAIEALTIDAFRTVVMLY